MAHVDEEEEVLCADVADDIADVLLEDGDHLGRAEQPHGREDVPDDDDGDCRGAEGRGEGIKCVSESGGGNSLPWRAHFGPPGTGARRRSG